MRVCVYGCFKLTKNMPTNRRLNENLYVRAFKILLKSIKCSMNGVQVKKNEINKRKSVFFLKLEI